MSQSTTHLSIGHIVVQAFLRFVVLQLWVNIMVLFVVHVVPYDASFKWHAALYDLILIPNYFIFLNMLAFRATITTLQIVVSIALLPFTCASEQVHRDFYCFTSTSLSGRLLRTFCTTHDELECP